MPEKKMILMSASPRRLKILRERGWKCVAAKKIADVEKDEKLIEFAEPDATVVDVTNRKLQANLELVEINDDCLYMVADTICFVEIDGTSVIINKCKSAEDVAAAFEYYKKVQRVNILTYEVVCIPQDGSLSFRDFKGTASIEFFRDGKCLLSDGFIKAYVESGNWKGRAGGIDFDYFKERGFAFEGEEDTIRGLCPFGV